MKTDISRTGSSLPPDRSSITSELSDYSSSSSSLDYKQPSSSLNTLNTALNTEKQACPVNTHVQIDNSNGPIQIGDINRITNIIFPPLDPELKEVIKKEASGAKIQLSSKRTFRRRNIILAIAGLVSLVTLVLTLWTVLSQKSYQHTFLPTNSNSTTFINSHQFYSRYNWGAVTTSFVFLPLVSPISIVIISHSATKLCSNFTNCSATIQNIQHDHITRGYGDIGYNFLVGGNGDIYEGRGWEYENMIRKKSLAVCFIGDYNYDFLNENLIDAAKSLLEEGIKINRLLPDYKLVGENQTSLSAYSPGKHIASEIRHWKHYFNGTIL